MLQSLSRPRNWGFAHRLLKRVIALRRFRSGGAFVTPFKVKLFVTNRCDLRCRHCNIWAREPDPEPELDTADYERFFARNRYFSVVSFSGGEPSLRPDLPDLIHMAANHALNPLVISVNLNGWDPDRTVRLVERALSGLHDRASLIATVSWDGPARVHDHVRRQAGAAARAEETIERLRRLPGDRLQVRRNVCISPFNLETIGPQLAERSSEGEACQVCFYQVTEHYHHGQEHRDRVPDFHRAMRRQIRAIRKGARAPDPIGRLYLDLAELFFAGERRNSVLPCFSGFASLIVDPVGRVYPCINYKSRLGDLRRSEFDLVGLLRAARARRVRSAVAAEQCPGCWTPNEAYATILCNLPNPNLAVKWLRSKVNSTLGSVSHGYGP